MSSKYVRDVIKDYLESNWTDTVIIDTENIFSSPPPGLDPWMGLMFAGGVETRPCLGALDVTRKRELGTIQFIVFVASGTGTDVALTYAERIRDLIRGKNLSGVEMQTVDPPDTAIPAQAQSSSGNFYGYSVSCDYEYDYI